MQDYSSLSDQCQSCSSYLMFKTTMAINETESLVAKNALRLVYVPVAIFAVVETALAAIAAGFGKVKSGIESILKDEEDFSEYRIKTYQEKSFMRVPQRDWTWLESSVFAIKWAFENLFEDYENLLICDEFSQLEFEMRGRDRENGMPIDAIFARDLSQKDLQQEHRYQIRVSQQDYGNTWKQFEAQSAMTLGYGQKDQFYN